MNKETVTKAAFDELLEEIAVLKIRVETLEALNSVNKSVNTQPVNSEPMNTPVNSVNTPAGPAPVSRYPEGWTSVPGRADPKWLQRDQASAKKVLAIVNSDEPEASRSAARACLAGLAAKHGLTVEQLLA